MDIKDLKNRCHELANRIEKKNFELICRSCNLDTERNGVERLYKFISFNSNKKLNADKIDTFAKGDLYASSPLDFNDPYDCELSFNLLDNYYCLDQFASNREERRKLKKKKAGSELGELQRELAKEWNKFRNEISVCCFTEHIDNFLMWSHYANCYNGICLEYDKSEIKDYLLAAINYTDQLESAIKNITVDDLTKNNNIGLLMSAVRSVFSKQNQWSYEREWRIVVSANSEDDRYIRMPIPKKLYVGFKLDAKIKKDIIQKAKQLGISEIVKTKISTKEYKLIHESII